MSEDSVPVEVAARADADVQITVPPHPIGLKVARKAGTPDSMLDAVNRKFAGMRGDYEAWAAEDIRRLRTLFEAAAPAIGTPAADVESLRKQAHDIKGQGATFGYNLITDIADSLCRYLRDVPPERQRKPVVAAHLDALDSVLSNKIRGGGGTIGEAIVAALAAAIRYDGPARHSSKIRGSGLG